MKKPSVSSTFGNKQIEKTLNETPNTICCVEEIERMEDYLCVEICQEINGVKRNETTGKCVELPNGTLKMTNSQTAIECSTNYVLRNNKCTIKWTFRRKFKIGVDFFCRLMYNTVIRTFVQ